MRTRLKKKINTRVFCSLKLSRNLGHDKTIKELDVLNKIEGML